MTRCSAVGELEVEKWAVCTVQGRYSNAKGWVHVSGQLSEEFELWLVFTGDLFSPPSLYYSMGAPFPDDLFIVVETLEEYVEKLKE